jgi:hypothetical protein
MNTASDRLKRIQRLEELYRHRHRAVERRVREHRETLTETRENLQRLQEQMRLAQTGDTRARPAGYVRLSGRRSHAMAGEVLRLRELRDRTAASLMADRREMTELLQVCRLLERLGDDARTERRRRRMSAIGEQMSEHARVRRATGDGGHVFGH